MNPDCWPPPTGQEPQGFGEWEYTSWVPHEDLGVVGQRWVPGIVNGFGQPVQLIPLNRYAYIERRAKFRVTPMPDSHLKWGEREFEYRRVSE